MLRLYFLPTAFAILAAAEQFPLKSIQVEGSAMPEAAIIKASGLRIGSQVDEDAFRAACGTLQETGLFESLNYRYAPTADRGFALTMIARDAARTVTAKIEIPGFRAADIWAWMNKNAPLVSDRVPSTEEAQRYYSARVEEYLAAQGKAQPVVGRMSGDLGSAKSMVLTFLPKNLPRVSAIEFSGASQINAATLVSLIEKLTVGQEFWETQFRDILERNVRPLYEQKGMLKVAFRSVEMTTESAGARIVTNIEEGPAYTLGMVTITGDGAEAVSAAAKFPTGKQANWDLILKADAAMLAPLRRTGFLTARSDKDRLFDDAARRVDLRLTVTKGPQYKFGKLVLEGLAAQHAEAIQKKWKLAPGDPVDGEYAAGFVKALLDANIVPGVTKAASGMKPGSGSQILDYAINLQ